MSQAAPTPFFITAAIDYANGAPHIGHVYEKILTDAIARYQRLAGRRRVRRVVTGALELERAAKRIGSSLEAAPQVFIADPDLLAALSGVDLAEISITSGIAVAAGDGPDDAFRMADIPGVAVVSARAPGVKCARSWKYFDPDSADPAFPEVTPRDARALRELGLPGR